MSANFDPFETLLSVIDWSKYSPEGWLDQYANWVDERNDGIERYTSPCADFLQDSVAQHRCINKFGACNISDGEARTVMRLILDLGGFDADCIVCIFESKMSYRKAARVLHCSVRDVQRGVDFGLGWISGIMGIKDDNRGRRNT